MKKGFTLIELIVAVSLLAMVLFFSSAVFKVSIDAYRMAVANAEIMQKCRAITDQINYDFRATQKSAYNKISFQMGNSQNPDGSSRPVRSDSIMFMSASDFQSTLQYDSNTTTDKTTVSGNVACIFYCLADVDSTDPRKKILLRRQTILAPPSEEGNKNLQGSGVTAEYDKTSLSEWNKTTFVGLMDRPKMDVTKNQDLAKYMAKGIDDFTIQSAFWNSTKKLDWKPKSNDPNFGSYGSSRRILTNAFKFSFTIYDSRGVIREGRRFTYIVYIGE